MPKVIIPGRIVTADVTRKLDPEIETTSKEGRPLLARTMFLKLTHGRQWKVETVEVSAAKSAPRVGGYSELYRKTDDFVMNTELQKQVADILSKVEADAEKHNA